MAVTGGVLRQNDTDNSADTWNRIGEVGMANFNLSGNGTVSLGARTIMAGQFGSAGTVTQTGGAFEVRAGDLTIGDLGAGTYNISAGTLRVLNPTNPTIMVGNWDNSQGNLTVSGTGLVEAGVDLVVANGNPNNTLPATGVVTQTGGMVRVGVLAGGDLRIGADAEADGTYNLNGGTLDLTGGNIVYGAGAHAFNFNGGRVQEAASTNFPLAQAGGTLAPGPTGAAGATAIGGDFGLAAPATLEIELFSPSVADLLTVTGAVSLFGNLDLIPASGLQVGNSFLILSNDGVDPITGTFAGKATTFIEDGYEFGISYTAGEGGNDVALTVLQIIPEPAAASFAVIGFGLLVGLRRRRR